VGAGLRPHDLASSTEPPRLRLGFAASQEPLSFGRGVPIETYAPYRVAHMRMITQRHSNADAIASREFERVEHVFAESGLLPDESARRLVRETVCETLAKLDPADKESLDAALLLVASSLFACAPSTLTADPARITRLADRLAADLGVPRARVARALLAAPEQLKRPAGYGAEVLLALLEAADRRLTRLGFDLHDGPLQELLLLGEDMRMFGEQLAAVLGERDEARLLRGRLEDLEARSIALERGLRQISTATGASVRTDRPFADAVLELTDAFTARTGIVPAVSIEGGLSSMSPSQRIALLSVVGEALNNVREHGGTATEVDVTIRLGADGVGARVRDNGCGFDVETALLDAARRGRIGLAGIYERVRLLDGECVVESRPGGPTTVSLKLPYWELHSGSNSAAAGGG
jgi:signal transduction histidine kinase